MERIVHSYANTSPLFLDKIFTLYVWVHPVIIRVYTIWQMENAHLLVERRVVRFVAVVRISGAVADERWWKTAEIVDRRLDGALVSVQPVDGATGRVTRGRQVMCGFDVDGVYRARAAAVDAASVEMWSVSAETDDRTLKLRVLHVYRYVCGRQHARNVKIVRQSFIFDSNARIRVLDRVLSNYFNSSEKFRELSKDSLLMDKHDFREPSSRLQY